MRICPKCSRVYSDESLKFCRLDGSELQNTTGESQTVRWTAPEHSPENTTAPLDSAPSIAVLPFANISNDAENEYFCDGLAEEILNALAKIESLKVAARTSAFSFKNRNINVSEIGRTLGVNSILEGSVRRSRDRVRITVQLVNARDGYHLWSERYDREMKDIFDVQDEITLAVVDALKVKLLGEEKAALLKRYTDNTEAYELYLKGRFYWQQLSPESQRRGIENFQRAIEIDPQYAPAYSGLSDCYSTIGWIRSAPLAETFARAKAAATKALEIDDRLAEAYVSLGYIRFLYDWNWKQSDREFKRAIEIQPTYAPIFIRRVMLWNAQGQIERAIADAEQAKLLDPLAPNGRLALGFTRYFARQYDRAILELSDALATHPNFSPAHIVIGFCHDAEDRFSDAIEAYQRAPDLQRYPLAISQLAYSYARAGFEDKAREILEELKHRTSYVSPYDVATIYMGLGDNDQAFAWFDRACDEHAGWLVFLNHMPRYDSLRADSRFDRLVQRLQSETERSIPG